MDIYLFLGALFGLGLVYIWAQVPWTWQVMALLFASGAASVAVASWWLFAPTGLPDLAAAGIGVVGFVSLCAAYVKKQNAC